MKKIALFLWLIVVSTQHAHQIHAPISVGELFDKISILEIKSQRIQNPNQLHNVERELQVLNIVLNETIQITDELAQLKQTLLAINEKLWEIEDAIRIKEMKKEFDSEFIELARTVYHLNDQRSMIKKNINLITCSSIIEEKKYAGNQMCVQTNT